jgi:HSP20 family protein
MANLIRWNEELPAPPAHWEPLKMMRDLMGWDPFAELAGPGFSREFGTAVFVPRFEVKETKDTYVFKADLPGIEEKDLEITFTGNRLTVSGRREAERHAEGESYYARERSYGTFNRSFTLPEGVEAEHAEAELKHGVLTVTIPKQEAVKPRKISLKGVGEKIKAAMTGKDKPAA